MRGTRALIDEMRKWMHSIGATYSERQKALMYKECYPALKEDYQMTTPLGTKALAQAEILLTNGFYEDAYHHLEDNLSYSKYWHKISCALSVLLGVSSELCFCYNAIGLIQDALSVWIQGAEEQIYHPAATTAFWLSNAYPIGFGITYGIDGARRFLAQALPLLIKGNGHDRAAAFTAVAIAGSSIGSGLAMAQGANIWGAINPFFTNLASLTMDAGYKVTEPFFKSPAKNQVNLELVSDR